MSAPPQPATPIGLLLCDDLMFTSRITGTARDLGLCIKPARSLEALHALIAEPCPRCVIVDLAHPELSIGALLERLCKVCTPRPYVVAYGSHIDTATLRSAKEAGCDVVWPRSKFVEELPRALPRWMRGETAAN
ncbi:MAG TPA: response regulator [Gemmataceae bacterium]|nr:response regulator [Gemmataceae bacterium]